jgi:hypothetical protein
MTDARSHFLRPSLAFLLGALYLVYKTLLFAGGWQSLPLFALFPIWPLLLVMAILMSMETFRRPQEPVLATTLFKNNARFALLTALSVSLCVWIYHQFVDVSAFREMIEERLQAYKQNPQTIPLAEYEKNLNKVFNPFFYATMTLSGLLAWGLLLSAGLTGLKVLFRRINWA